MGLDHVPSFSAVLLTIYPSRSLSCASQFTSGWVWTQAMGHLPPESINYSSLYIFMDSFYYQPINEWPEESRTSFLSNALLHLTLRDELIVLTDSQSRCSITRTWCPRDRYARIFTRSPNSATAAAFAILLIKSKPQGRPRAT